MSVLLLWFLSFLSRIIFLESLNIQRYLSLAQIFE